MKSLSKEIRYFQTYNRENRYRNIDAKIESCKIAEDKSRTRIFGYFAKEENVEGDNPPIGIILSHYKDELMVEYATYQK